MKTSVTYNVELNYDELKHITTSLHRQYLWLRENANEKYTSASAVRDLRNSFASLCGITYMGVDA